MSTRMFATYAAIGAGILMSAEPEVARAQRTTIDSSLQAQSYTVTSPYGRPLVRRRRFMHTLGLGVYDVHGTGAGPGPRLSVVTRLRLDADLGQLEVERDPSRLEHYVPGLQQTPIDLMFAYVDAQSYLGGWLGARLGRQYMVDTLGWWSFDGALATVTTPVFLRLEAFGGAEQRGGLPWMSTHRFEADGVYRGARDGLEADQWPSYLEQSKPAPAFGFAVESVDAHWIHARLSYRKVFNRDPVRVAPFADASGGQTIHKDTRISTERVGGSVWVTEAKLGELTASGVYDLLGQVFGQHGAMLGWYATEQITLGVGYDYFFPTFDGDSVFNWFTRQPTLTYLGRGSWQLSRRWLLSATTGIRQFRTEGEPDAYLGQPAAFGSEAVAREKTGVQNDVLGSWAMQYRFACGTVSIAGIGEAGDSGHQVGGDVALRRDYAGGLYDTLVLVSVYDWQDKLRTGRDATSFSYVLGGGVAPFDRTRMGLEWEHSVNRLVGHRFRLLGTLAVAVLP